MLIRPPRQRLRSSRLPSPKTGFDTWLQGKAVSPRRSPRKNVVLHIFPSFAAERGAPPAYPSVVATRLPHCEDSRHMAPSYRLLHPISLPTELLGSGSNRRNGRHGQVSKGAVAGQHHNRPGFVRRSKTVKPNIAPVIPPAKSPPLPNRTGRLSLLGRLHSLYGREVPVPECRDSSGASECLPNQRRAIQLRSPCRNLSGAQQFGIEDDLDRFHMWIQYSTSILHSQHGDWFSALLAQHQDYSR